MRGGNPVQDSSSKFTANPCRSCGAIILAGRNYGIPLDLEPTMLTDLDEYHALRDNVPTYDLWPDGVVRRRDAAHIRHRDLTARHARHTCGQRYGTQPRPRPDTPATPNRDRPPTL